MRKIYGLLFAFVCSATMLSAQKGRIGITLSTLSDNSVTRFGSGYMDDSSTDAGKSHTIGIIYLKPLNNWLELETGIEYLKCDVTKSSIIIGYNNGLMTYSHSNPLSLINIPVGIRANFWKYCFVNGGLILDMDVSSNSSIQSQSGLGSLVGFGLKYDFRFGISLFLNPFMKVHSIIPFTSGKDPEHLLESALRIGLTYKL